MKFSVIIPAYNAVKWIKKCLDSVFEAASAYASSPSSALSADDSPAVEVIVVDDGSTDDTVAAVIEFMKDAVPVQEDLPSSVAVTTNASGAAVAHCAFSAFAGSCNIFVYCRPHAGQGAARNFGLTAAIGDYVWFADADDFIDRNSFLELAAAVSRKVDLRSADAVPLDTGWRCDCPDVVAVCAADVDENAEDAVARRRFSWKGLSDCSGRQFLASGRKLYVGTPFSVYRRAFLDKYPLRFIEGIYHEDAEFTPRAWFYASRIGFVDEVLYYVRLTSGSTTRSANPKRAFDSLRVAQKSLAAFRDSLESCSAAYAPFATDPASHVVTPASAANAGTASVPAISSCDAPIDRVPLRRVLRGFDDLLASDLNHALKNCYRFDAGTNRELNRCVFEGRSYLFPPLRRSSHLKFRLEYIAFLLFPRHTVEVYRLMHLFVRTAIA